MYILSLAANYFTKVCKVLKGCWISVLYDGNKFYFIFYQPLFEDVVFPLTTTATKIKIGYTRISSKTSFRDFIARTQSKRNPI